LQTFVGAELVASSSQKLFRLDQYALGLYSELSAIGSTFLCDGLNLEIFADFSEIARNFFGHF